MNCNLCELEIGQLAHPINVRYTFCENCQNNTIDALPDTIVYYGIIMTGNEYKHVFRTLDVIHCPYCQAVVESVFYDCKADGTVIDLLSIKKEVDA